MKTARQTCVLTCLAVALCVVTTSALAGKPGDTIKKLLDGADINNMVNLPSGGGLVAFTANGKLYIMSKNGRFLFDGTLLDVWNNGHALNSMTDIKHYALRLDFDELGLDFSKLVTVDIGHGKRPGTIFIGADCADCATAVKQAEALADTDATRFVVVPSQGHLAGVQAISCAAPANRVRLLDQLYTDHPPTPGTNCTEQSPLSNTVMAAILVGASRVPMVVAPDGRVAHGLPPQGLAAFYHQEITP